MNQFLLIFLIFVNLWFVICGSGCESIAKNRRLDYVRNHPELSIEQKKLLLKGKLWVGMVPEEVRVSLGNPNLVQKDILGEKEVWSYIYKDQFTTRRKYAFDRVLRLEFLSGRLANWRED